jgi:hypothetical protein
MEVDPTKLKGRITESRYKDLPEGHRTSLVVGMADMLQCLSKYMDARTQNSFEPIFEYMEPLVSGDLRGIFDSYLATDSSPTIGIASSFLSMLIEKSGASRKISN